MPTASTVDRARAIRAALRALVAERGFHGASMSAIAERAGVATGTAYVHYGSKDELVIAAYLETKRDLAAAAVARVEPDDAPRARFLQLWHGVHDHLRAAPDRARFLLQVEASPYAADAHDLALANDDVLVSEATRPDLAAQLTALPYEVLFDLGLGPAVRLAARGTRLTGEELERVATGSWRAVTSDTIEL